MNIFRPYDPNRPLFGKGCSCGQHETEEAHQQSEAAKISAEQLSADFIATDLSLV